MSQAVQAFVERLDSERQPWSVRRACIDDDAVVARFLDGIFHDFLTGVLDRSLGPRYLRWLLRENPAGEGVGWVAEVGAEPLGFASWAPAEVWWRGRLRSAFQMGPIAVDPRWRNQGLFLHLIHVSSRDLRARMEFGFSVGQRPVVTRAIMQYFDWRHGLDLIEHVLPIRPEALPDGVLPPGLRARAAKVTAALAARSVAVALAALVTRAGQWQVDRVTEVDGRLAQFVEDATVTYDWAIRRTAASLRWRYLANPLFQHELLVVAVGPTVRGYVALHVNRLHHGVIDDLFVRRGDRAGYLACLVAAVRRFLELEVGSIRLKQQRRHWAGPLVRVVLPFVRANVVSLVTGQSGGEDAGDRARWHLATGDIL